MTLDEIKQLRADLDKAYHEYLESEPKVVGEAHHEYKKKRIEYMSKCSEYVEDQIALNKVL